MTKTLPRYVGPDVSADGRKMTQEEIKARFDAESAAVYSRGRGLPWLPEHAAVMGLAVETLRAYLPASARVLDLGAGTGNLARRILRAFPDAHVTLADFSPNMLGEAPRVLRAFRGRYETVLADFWQGQFPEAAYDAVVSSFAPACRQTGCTTGATRRCTAISTARFTAGSRRRACSCAATWSRGTRRSWRG